MEIAAEQLPHEDQAQGGEMHNISWRGQDQLNVPKQFAQSGSGENGNEDEGDVCRICRTSGDELYYPCACSGSIKYVHQDCLLQWLSHSNARQCEVCKHSFSFSPVYAENAPTRLPVSELLYGVFVKAGRWLRFFGRLMFVLSIWLLFIPFITFWVWRLTFVRSVAEAQKLFISRFTPGLLFTDCLNGFLLSAGIVFVFLGVTSLREYMRHVREANGHDGDREGAAVDRQQGARAVRHGNGAPGQRGAAAAANDPQGGVVVPAAIENVDAGGHGLAAGAGQLLRRNAENMAARLEMQAARLEAHVEQMFDAAEDVDGAEDLPFEELVGMQGPVLHLVENAITVLASNAIFLGLIALVPFTIGRLVLSVISHLVVATRGASVIAALALGEMSNIHTSSFHLTQFPGINSTSQDMIFSDKSEEVTIFPKGDIEMVTGVGASGNRVDAMAEALAKALPFSDAATVAVGYGAIFLSLSLYLGMLAMLRYGRGEPLTVGRIRGVAEAAPSIARQVISAVKYVATMVKVAFLLIIELGVFPLMCGWWLDVCTLGMLNITLAQRISFFWESPLTSSLVHWLVGILYMLQISIFVSLLREVLRPGVLYFLRDPADPNYNPFRDLIDDPIHKHARRVLLSVVVYGSLIVMLVFLPVQLATSLAPSIFPLDIRVSDPFTELPADMLLFHICIPFAVEHFRPRTTIKTVLFHWFTFVGWALGLSDYLLPAQEDANRASEQHDAHHRNPHDSARLPASTSQASNDQQQTGIDDDASDKMGSEEYKFVIRIVLLLLGAWFTLLVFNSSLVLLPVSLGRSIVSSLSRLPITRGANCNDLYAFNIGCFMIWATITAIRYVVDYLKTHDVQVLVKQILKWSSIIAKSIVLLSLWIIVIPVLIGLLFELLAVVPLRVPVDESPVFILYQDWALGLVFLKIWTRLVMIGQLAPLADENWRTKFEQVRADGFSNLRARWVFQEIVAPILVKLLTALCIPYVIARGIFPSFGFSLVVNSAVYRFAWVGCLVLALAWYGMRQLHQWLLDLHNSIRDDRYLVGRRLHNFGERKFQPAEQYESVDGRDNLESTEGTVDETSSLGNVSSEAIAEGIQHSTSPSDQKDIVDALANTGELAESLGGPEVAESLSSRRTKTASSSHANAVF